MSFQPGREEYATRLLGMDRQLRSGLEVLTLVAADIEDMPDFGNAAAPYPLGRAKVKGDGENSAGGSAD